MGSEKPWITTIAIMVFIDIIISAIVLFASRKVEPKYYSTNLRTNIFFYDLLVSCINFTLFISGIYYFTGLEIFCFVLFIIYTRLIILF